MVFVRSIRIAFLTPTFATEPDSGGMGAYLHRIAKALIGLGHEPVIFTLSEKPAGPVEFEGIQVVRVRLPQARYLSHLERRIPSSLQRFLITDLVDYLRGAFRLAHAFYQHDGNKSFHIVQSSDYGLAGLFIQVRNRPHLVRCSWAGDLFIQVDGKAHYFDARLYCLFERHCIRKADIAYAPSEFVANYYRKQHQLVVQVLRPPFLMDSVPSMDLPDTLPRRYLMYFGAINRRKGTDVLAQALPLVWQQEPKFTMVWAGESWNGALERYRQNWGKYESCIYWLGYIGKSQVFSLLKLAEAVIIPSRVDNLPNTLIESLLLNTPVIGSDGASINELVQPGRNGALVPIGDAAALAQEMLKCWRGESPWSHLTFEPPPALQEMEPSVAAHNLLKLAGY